MRWMAFIGRIGIIFSIIGLTLLVVSFIPSEPPSRANIWLVVDAKKYEYSDLGECSSEIGISINVNSNGSIGLYLLSVKQDQLNNWAISWVKEHYPNLTDWEISLLSRNVSVLNVILQNHSDSILWNSSLITNVSYEFLPTNTVNVTLVIVNMSLNRVKVKIVVREVFKVTPRDRIILSTQLFILLGIILSIPWIIYMKRK